MRQYSGRVLGLKDEKQSTKIQIGILKQKAILGKIEEISTQQKNVILFEEDLDTTIVRNVVNALVEKHEGNCAVFTGNDNECCRFILGSKTLDCREMASKLRERFGAKCGGGQVMIQGSLEVDKESILQLFEEYICFSNMK